MNTLGQNSKTYSTVILGPGAIGGFLAAALWKQGIKVTIVARPETARFIKKKGLCLESALLGNFIAHPEAVENLTEIPDVIFITTKTPGLSDALLRITSAVGQNTVLIPLLNGIEHIDFLREHFGSRISVGMIGGIVAKKKGPGHIVSDSTDVHIDLSSDKDISKEALDVIAHMLKESGISTSILDSEHEVVWRKLVRLNALAAVTAASGKTLGELRDDLLWREKLTGCVKEGSLVAEKEGVVIDAKEVINQIDKLPASLTTSLQRDVSLDQESEADVILGAVIRRAKKYGLPYKTVDEMFTLIKEQIKKNKK